MVKKQRGFDAVIGLFFICLFAAAQFFALAAGAGIYREIGAALDYQYAARTAVGYLTAKARQYDAEGAVGIRDFGGAKALVIRENLDGADYLTYVYCWDGYIRELFCEAGAALTPDAGEKIVAAESLSFALNGGLLRMDCVTDGAEETAWVYLASMGEGESP